MKTIENRIRVLRAAHRMTQGELGDLMGISRQQVSAIENQKTEGLSWDQMAKLVEIFKLDSVEQLLEIKDADEGQKAA